MLYYQVLQVHLLLSKECSLQVHHLFHHSRQQAHCLGHLYTVKPRPPGAMQLSWLWIANYQVWI